LEPICRDENLNAYIRTWVLNMSILLELLVLSPPNSLHSDY